MTAIPGVTTPTGYFPEDTTGVRPPIIGEKDDSFAESMFIDEINPYAVGGGFDVTAPRETDEGTRFAYPEDKPLVPPANTGGSSKDGKSGKLTPEELENLKASLGEQVPISGIEKVINQVIGKAFFGLGSGFADKLKASSEAERQAIVDQHLNALNSGATPVYNDKGEYIGFNMNTMDTFADKVLAADDISVFLPGGSADADGDGDPAGLRRHRRDVVLAERRRPGGQRGGGTASGGDGRGLPGGAGPHPRAGAGRARPAAGHPHRRGEFREPGGAGTRPGRADRHQRQRHRGAAADPDELAAARAGGADRLLPRRRGEPVRPGHPASAPDARAGGAARPGRGTLHRVRGGGGAGRRPDHPAEAVLDRAGGAARGGVRAGRPRRDRHVDAPRVGVHLPRPHPRR